MKPILAALSHILISDKLFLIKEVNLFAFSTAFHFHKECQLVHVMESADTRIIGDMWSTLKVEN